MKSDTIVSFPCVTAPMYYYSKNCNKNSQRCELFADLLLYLHQNIKSKTMNIDFDSTA